MKIVEKVYYEDVTKEWLANATQNSHEVKDLMYYEYDGMKYYVDDKNVILDYSKKEKEVAEWLRDTFGGEIFMIPRINKPEKIKTPDYIFRNKKFDLKEINGKSVNAIDDAIKSKRKQANNFIIDITNTILSINEILCQAKKVYRSEKRYWVDILIIKENNSLIAVLKRK